MPNVRTLEGEVLEVDSNFVDECATLFMAATMLNRSDAHASFDPIPVPIDFETMKRVLAAPKDVPWAAEYLGYKKIVKPE